MLSRKQILTLFMIRNQKKNTLSELAVPKELLMLEVGRYSVNRLLEYVIDINYYEMARMLRDDPMLMFYTGTAKDTDGQTITTTPFEYVLKNLDTYAWKLCYAIALEDKQNKELYLKYFQKYANSFNACIDLSELQIAYGGYLDACDLHKSGHQTLEKLKETWLNVGMAQRKHIPRHLLREMAALNFNLEMTIKDLVLLTVEPNKELTLDYLKQLSKEFNNCPILVNKQHIFAFYRVNALRELHCVETTELPFKHIAFPEKPNSPIIKKIDKDNCQEHFDYYGPWQNIYCVELTDYIPFEFPTIPIVSESCEPKKFEMGDSEFNLCDLGEEYTLARGAGRHWLGTAFPFGAGKLLNYRATHDLRTFGNLVELRLEERQMFFNEILEVCQEKETSDRLVKFNKMTIK